MSALTFLAHDEDRLGRFLALTGLAPQDIRAAAGRSGFLVGVLDYLMQDEQLLLAFAAEARIKPEAVGQAHTVLNGSPADAG